MDKEDKRLAVLEASDQEHLMRQEREDLESGGDSGDQDEYFDSRSAAVDEVIYHRVLDSFDVIRGERDKIREKRNRNLEDLASIGGDLLDVIPETQEERGRGKRGVSLEDGQVLSDSDGDGDGDTPFLRGGWITVGFGERTAPKPKTAPKVLDKAVLCRALRGGWRRQGSRGWRPSWMCPRPEDTEEDCKGMEYDTDFAEDVYYYILEAPQPWTVGRIFRAAVKKFIGTDRPTFHATIVATLVTMRKTAQHVLMSSIRAGPPSPDDAAIPVYMDLSQVEFYQGGQAL